MKPQSEGRVRCSAWLGVMVCRLKMAYSDTCLTKCPTDSGLRKLRVGMARSVWNLWWRLRAFRNAQRPQRNVPLRRSVLLLLCPAQYMLWPHPTKWRELTLMQKLARAWVRRRGPDRSGNHAPQAGRTSRPTPAQCAVLLACARMTPNDPSSATASTARVERKEDVR